MLALNIGFTHSEYGQWDNNLQQWGDRIDRRKKWGGIVGEGDKCLKLSQRGETKGPPSPRY